MACSTQANRIDEDMTLLTLDLLARVIAVRIDIAAALLGALHALAVDHTRGWAWLALHYLAALQVERVVDCNQRVVIVPTNQIVIQGAFRWQILRNIAPLTPCAQHIHDPVDDLAHIDFAVSAAALGWWDERFDERPLCGGKVAGIAQLVAVVFDSVVGGPHLVARQFVGP